ncbi:uncharacterized protein [Chiloscyllium punctatum]|uniref:uncharacterized protein isoform X1 n=1 Tax=Chiloscyllium punctatum TaxID=137246 RepID=UPI003B636579
MRSIVLLTCYAIILGLGLCVRVTQFGLWLKQAEDRQWFTISVLANQSTQTLSLDLCELVPCRTKSQLNQTKQNLERERGFQGQTLVLQLHGREGLSRPPAPGVQAMVSVVRDPITPGRDCGQNQCNPLYLTIKNLEKNEASLNRTILGIRVGGQAGWRGMQLCCTYITVIEAESGGSSTTDQQEKIRIIETTDLEKTFEIETGYGEANAWMEWVKYTVRSIKKSDCYACTSARPNPQVVPFPLGWEKHPRAMDCMIRLYQDREAWNDPTCRPLSLKFPPVRSEGAPRPPSFSGVTGMHQACVFRTGLQWDDDVGTFDKCSGSIRLVNETTEGGNYSHIHVPRADLWWYCGGRVLQPTLPQKWTGTCAIVQLAIPFILVFEKQERPRSSGRTERALETSFDDNIYLDAIGVPRGVPDEYKARNQIAAGFESSLFWWVTINKNVDWINYIYYNQQRFINYTRDAVKGIAEQLDATSRMAWENRLALDMMLAEKGGVCVMIGIQCCTFIPNNTAPDGSITRALDGLTTLADELAENSGIDSGLTDWLEAWFDTQDALDSTEFPIPVSSITTLKTVGQPERWRVRSGAFSKSFSEAQQQSYKRAVRNGVL